MSDSNHSAEVGQLQIALELARRFLNDDPMTAWHRLSAVQHDLRAFIDKAGRKDAELVRMEAYASELVEEARVARERWQSANEQRELQMRERERAYIPA